MPISKNQIKLITSLQQKKYRVKEGLFVAEGIKVVNEFLNSEIELQTLFCVDEVLGDYKNYACVSITENELKKISVLKSPNKVLGLFKIPSEKTSQDNGLKVVLDTINDPGNLGTIIRLCDWFGVKELICSKDTVDCYNTKVVQSTMGSLTRVVVKYVDLIPYLKDTQQPVYITDMEGENVYAATLPENGIIIMGNEANGVSSEIKQLISRKLTIPRFGELQATESLNVATATAILLNEFRRATGKLK
ncbi:TrmH family RNA methyltransferase [Wenyingzhuangia marina]|uniref:RNA methyltransferase, TrmH family n=1 Tax=Wenyingzhuangia marina TaxID=1195760 RepID=A0A1M5S7V8_9FLAO|nr:RNA methyltransferase [Wenyingzhuangia marina]GGF61173.1 RNA methyltransferase [Wenyingzhuangia marina]SHH34574.1 RNA methyltransferase, TrmH family [Wenyingzhuangia marina]